MVTQSPYRPSPRGQDGFSLIEVMIAVVILATGLLALAALQINLTQSSADAKTRSRMAALLTSVVDYQRAQGYSSISPVGLSSTNPATTSFQCTTSSPTAIQSAICTAQTDAGVSGLTLTQTVSRYVAAPGVSTYTLASSSNPSSTTPIYGDYKQLQLVATWTDAAGTSRSFAGTAIVSDIDLNAGAGTVLSTNLLASANMTPVVHEANPSLTSGVIPIAIGSNTNTAATNPKPAVQTSGAASTTYTTLTYTQGVNDTAATSTIQKRVETEIVECACQGSSTNPFASSTLFGEFVYRPTYWNGTQYASPVVATTSSGSNVVPFGSAASSISPQSPECNVCCRDHLDFTTPSAPSSTALYSAPLYDPVTGDPNRYQLGTTTTTSHGKTTTSISNPMALAGSAGSRVAVTNFTSSSQAWLDSCRMIRVDGLWRVAADLEAANMGFIATSPKGFATSSTPDTSAASAYQDFAVDYLGQFLTYVLHGGSAPNSNTVFANHGLNDPTVINALTTAGNYRYLHARGLYVDHLEAAAIRKLVNVNSGCAAANFPTCLLPYLPFSSINLTGVGYRSWQTSASANAAVGQGTDSGSTGVCSSTNFFGGCVAGKSNTTSVNITDTLAHSNSALAASLPVSPYEEVSTNSLSKTQNFTVTGTSTADQYFAQLSGPTVTLTDPTTLATSQTLTWLTFDASTTNDPNVSWGFGPLNGTAGPDACFSTYSNVNDTDPDPYDCVTTVLTTSLPINTAIGNYNQVVQNPITNPCVGGTGNFNQPTLVCYTVSGATLTTDQAATNRIDCYGGGSTSTSTNCYNITTPFTVSGTKTTGETTTITIAAKTGTPTSNVSNSYLNVTFAANGVAYGGFTCDPVTLLPTFTTPTSCP